MKKVDFSPLVVEFEINRMVTFVALEVCDFTASGDQATEE